MSHSSQNSNYPLSSVLSNLHRDYKSGIAHGRTWVDPFRWQNTQMSLGLDGEETCPWLDCGVSLGVLTNLQTDGIASSQSL